MLGLDVGPYNRQKTLTDVASCGYIEDMKSVGLRELKNRLSAYVRELRSGETVLVTDRGEVVAGLVPPGQSGHSPEVPSALVALARSGQLTLGAPNQAELYPKLSPLLPRPRATASGAGALPVTLYAEFQRGPGLVARRAGWPPGT
jgi:prevent-host-death family protein